MAPVFNLEDMLKAEAEKLREKVEEASLMAAKAVEEAEQKVQELAKESIGSSDIPEKEIEDMVSSVIPFSGHIANLGQIYVVSLI